VGANQLTCVNAHDSGLSATGASASVSWLRVKK
jgi:hypothetical protein